MMTDFIEVYDTEILLVEDESGSVLEYVGSAIIVGGAVQKVNGQIGDITLTAADVAADPVGSAEAVRTDLQLQIDDKADTATVNQQIDGINQQLPNFATQNYVLTALTPKASMAYVDNEVLALAQAADADATNKANTARTQAIAAAATDASNKINNLAQGRAVVTANTALLAYKQNGAYFGAVNLALTDAPANRDSTKEFVLRVESIIDTDRYKQQTYIETQTGKIWIRTIDLQSNTVRKDWATAQVDDASVTTSKLATAAATRAKLSNNFLFNSVLVAGTLLSAATKDGMYFGTASNHADIPSSSLNPADTFIVENRDVTGIGRFIYQKLTRYPQLDRTWDRVIDTNSSTTVAWTRRDVLAAGSVTTTTIADKSVTATKLADLYRYKGLVDAVAPATVSLNTITADGVYVVVAANTTDNPANISGNFVLVVENCGSNYVLQRAVKITDGSKTATRTIRPANNVFYDWKSPDAGQVNGFAGKKIAFLGDSITEFGTYPQQVANALGATALNMGIGGTRMGMHTQSGYDELCGYKIAKAINTGNFAPLDSAAAGLIVSDNDDNTAAVNLIKATDWATVDYLIVGYGTNDFGGNRPVGAYTENLSDGSTFAGAANYFIQMIQSKYPQIKIVFTTPIWRKKTPTATGGIEGGSDVSPNTLGKYLIEYADELIKVAQANHIEVLDLYRKSGISKYTEQLYLNQTDMLHPLNPGYELLASKVAGFLRGHF